MIIMFLFLTKFLVESFFKVTLKSVLSGSSISVPGILLFVTFLSEVCQNLSNHVFSTCPIPWQSFMLKGQLPDALKIFSLPSDAKPN